MRTKRSFTILMVVVFMLGIAAHAMAGTALQKITAYIDSDIKVNLNGSLMNLADKPITYNGRTYLPVRGIAEAVNLPVSWDGTTKTVFLGKDDQTKGVSWFNYSNNFLRLGYSKEKDKISIHDQFYNEAFYLENMTGGAFVQFNLKGEKYNTLSFKIGMIGNGSVKVKVYDTDLDAILKTFDLSKSNGMKDVVVELFNTNRLKIEITQTGSVDQLVLAEGYLK